MSMQWGQDHIVDSCERGVVLQQRPEAAGMIRGGSLP